MFALERGRVLVRVVAIAFGSVAVHMLMRQRRVQVRMRVVLGQVQPDTERHQDGGSHELPGDGFGQEQHREQRGDDTGLPEGGRHVQMDLQRRNAECGLPDAEVAKVSQKAQKIQMQSFNFSAFSASLLYFFYVRQSDLG
jgi:uncharacterized membrane protein